MIGFEPRSRSHVKLRIFQDDENNLMTRCNGFGLKRGQSVGDVNHPRNQKEYQQSWKAKENV